MPFPGSETALGSTIGRPVEGIIAGVITLRPAASQGPSTTFQSLTRRLNDLHEGSTAYREDPGWPGSFSKLCSIPTRWNLVSNALPAGNGTRPRSTNPRDPTKVMWKTARCAASRMCCGSSMTILPRNSLLQLNWSEETDLGPRTSDLLTLQTTPPSKPPKARLLCEEHGKCFLPLDESAFHLAADEPRIRQIAQKTKANFVVDHVADERSLDPFAALRVEFVAMMPALERALVLHVGEVVIPFEFGDARDPRGANGKKREDTE